MGHVESDGAAGKDGEAQQLWSLWARLRAAFPVWSFGFSNFESSTAWGVWGNDLVSGLRRTRAANRTAALLAAWPVDMLERLRALAEINVQRHDHMFKTVALGYLSLPLAAGALAADVAPDFLQEIYTESARAIWLTVTAFASSVLLSMAGLWRARQMASVLDLLILERRCASAGTVHQPINRAA